MGIYNKSNIERIIDLENKVDKLILSAVSNQRELLIGLLTKLENGGGNAFIDKEQIVSDYLADN